LGSARAGKEVAVRSLPPALALTAVLLLTAGCGQDTPVATDDAPASAAPVDYSSTLQAPPRSSFSDSDETPGPDDGLADLTLADGSRVVVWIDPDDLALVTTQHSDPADPTAWTAPQTIFRAGAGCLVMDAATNGEVVAVGLGCYESDPFIQQAPDQGAALVTADLRTWQVDDDLGEFFSEPEVSPEGDVRFENGVYPDQAVLWTADGGFSQE
jgi:hypothetical protein